ncbi:hypothetical protein KY290_025270 [Solanum tuberosum]|uniref:DUF674 family protein n=1 Tax=Solanum tuberosum TaxID=4113 RepID=A0ABQ7UT49_SOLTU|nr:hypothetical protein KY284_024076 [Solanum tuberosum]KAH0755000.1 hypothetical protein KY290_025270 [Solanum tuberosum]
MEQVMETTNFGLKLLVDSKAHKVVFAECGKDFIDFLFTILKLPIGYFFGQPSKMSVLGCLGNMIPIMENFGDDLMQLDELGEVMTWIITDDLFIAPLSATSVINVLNKSKAQVDPLQYKTIDFQISDLTGWRKSNNGEKCSVKLTVDSEANRVVFVEATPNMFLDNDGGYVKGLIVYMVTDDLSVTPLSMISALSKLDICTNVESNAEFEVKIGEFGVNEALGFLEASFQSRTVLSDTFLEG